jgi:hypothetical protein
MGGAAIVSGLSFTRGGAARAIAEKLNTTAHARKIGEMQRI